MVLNTTGWSAGTVLGVVWIYGLFHNLGKLLEMLGVADSQHARRNYSATRARSVAACGDLLGRGGHVDMSSNDKPKIQLCLRRSATRDRAAPRDFVEGHRSQRSQRLPPADPPVKAPSHHKIGCANLAPRAVYVAFGALGILWIRRTGLLMFGPVPCGRDAGGETAGIINRSMSRERFHMAGL